MPVELIHRQYGNKYKGVHKKKKAVLRIGSLLIAEVYAMAYGIVIYSKYGNGYGNRIIIYHPDSGYCTVYQHLSSMYVTPGTIVQKGYPIGYTGKTGGDYGIHLHFEVWNYFDYEGRKRPNNSSEPWFIDHPDVQYSINPIEKYWKQDPRKSSSNPNPMFIIQNGKFVYNENFCYSFDNDSGFTANIKNNKGYFE